jgi:signal transduction histidine kinase
VTVFRDVTEAKRDKAELLESKEKAESAGKLKDRFLTLVAHDLKSPLASVVGFLSYIKKRNSTENGTEGKMLDLAKKNLDGLLQLVDTLLDMNRLQSGHITPRYAELDLGAGASGVINQIGYLAAEKEITIVNDLKEGAVVKADLHLFSRVVQNLLTNAIKFSKRGDSIHIYQPPGKADVLAVRDAGVGILPCILPKIFIYGEMTSRPGTESERGNGYGLPLSYEIIKAHGGEIRVESELGKGTTFFVQLPASTSKGKQYPSP